MSVELREMLYLDVERVRGLAGQLWPDGIPESLQQKSGSQKSGKAGFSIVEGSYSGAVEDVETRALAESLFPLVESELEREAYLVDASEWATDESNWDRSELSKWAQPGDLLRLRAPGTLIDSRHFAQMAASFGAVMSGTANLGLLDEQSGKGDPQRPKMENPKSYNPDSEWREDHIAPMPELRDFRPRELRGMVQLARGLFPEGVHLHMAPVAGGPQGVWCRLQEGRSYLDSEPEVLFSRYGLNSQPWSVVGVVGTVAREGISEYSPTDIVDGDRVVRSSAMEAFNGFVQHMTTLGFGSGPQFPGFSLVPIAVYREIRRATESVE